MTNDGEGPFVAGIDEKKLMVSPGYECVSCPPKSVSRLGCQLFSELWGYGW